MSQHSNTKPPFTYLLLSDLSKWLSFLIYKNLFNLLVCLSKVIYVVKTEHKAEIATYSDWYFFQTCEYRLWNLCYCFSKDPESWIQWERRIWLPGKTGFSDSTVKIFVRVLWQPTRNPQQLSGRKGCCQWLCLAKGKDRLLRVLSQLAASPCGWVS